MIQHSTLSMKDTEAGNRDARFQSLNRRNNIVALLRIGVPGIGLLVAGFLIFQIVLTNLANDFAISGLRVEQDQVVIDEPRYGGVTADGTKYNIVAQEARIDINARDIINLQNATITIVQADGYEMIAETDTAQLNLDEQFIYVPGLMVTQDSDQVAGRFNDSIIDWTAQTLVSKGAVKVEFKDGAIINAQSLTYDAPNRLWDFGPTIYNLAGDGGI